MGSALTAILSGVVGAALVTLVNNIVMFKLNRKAAKEDREDKNIDERLDNHDKEIGSFRGALIALLHDRLFQGCNYHLSRGHINQGELENIEQVYNAYHSLGGNGTGTEIYERVKKLPLELEGGVIVEKAI